MSSESVWENMPALIGEYASCIPKALMPSSVKALNRLVTASIDIPVAWLEQRASAIKGRTGALSKVETAIAGKVSKEVVKDQEIIDRAINTLVAKEYRSQYHKESVAISAAKALQSIDTESASDHVPEIDDEWLDVFERYAENASSARLQDLWGRVLAGEIRTPGHFSLRTLRFLSEFTQSDALTFANFSELAFGDIAPLTLFQGVPAPLSFRDLIYLEAIGLIHGVSSANLTVERTMQGGQFYIQEGKLLLRFTSVASVPPQEVYAVTPLGQELMMLLSDRDPIKVAKRIADTLRYHAEEAELLRINSSGELTLIDVLWTPMTRFPSVTPLAG